AHFHAARKRIRDGDPDPVQAAGEGIGPSGFLVELAPSVQSGEDHFDHGNLLLLVHTYGNAASVVLDGRTAVRVQRDADATAETGQRFVGSVVYDLLNDVQRVLGAGVHAGALPDRFQAF